MLMLCLYYVYVTLIMSLEKIAEKWAYKGDVKWDNDVFFIKEQ